MDLVRTDQYTLQTYAANLDASLKFAQMLIGTQMVPPQFRKPQEVVAAILYGQELGLTPMHALQTVEVIQGKPTLNAAGLQALAIKAGGEIEDLELTDEVCRLKITRGKLSREFKYTMKDAIKAGLATKDNWKKMPQDMLYARCVSRGVRRMFADILKGFYSAEEMRDSVKQEPRNVTPTEPPKVLEYENGDVVDMDTGEVREEIRYAVPYSLTNVRQAVKAQGFTYDPGTKHWVGYVSVPEAENFRVLPVKPSVKEPELEDDLPNYDGDELF